MNTKRNCGWCRDGRCAEDSVCQRYHCHPKCEQISKCKQYISDERLREKCDERANDRPPTDDTQKLVVLYYCRDKNTVAQIAYQLCRSIAAIENILTKAGVLNG